MLSFSPPKGILCFDTWPSSYSPAMEEKPSSFSPPKGILCFDTQFAEATSASIITRFSPPKEGRTAVTLSVATS
jgi:hypothetical protein